MYGSITETKDGGRELVRGSLMIRETMCRMILRYVVKGQRPFYIFPCPVKGRSWTIAHSFRSCDLQ